MCVSSLLPASAAAQAGVLRMPPGMPAHVGIGVVSPAGSTAVHPWLPETRVPWDYAAVTLTGGVNTGDGWQDRDPEGQGASLTAGFASSASQAGHTPVFTYAQLLPSFGACNACSEPVRYLSNLNEPGVTAAYFQDFRTLMQHLSGAGRVIVHVEPDLSGYAMQA